MSRQWFIEGVQVNEQLDYDYFVFGVQIGEDQPLPVRIFPTPRQSRFDVPVRSKGYTIPRASKFPVEPGAG